MSNLAFLAKVLRILAFNHPQAAGASDINVNYQHRKIYMLYFSFAIQSFQGFQIFITNIIVLLADLEQIVTNGDEEL